MVLDLVGLGCLLPRPLFCWYSSGYGCIICCIFRSTDVAEGMGCLAITYRGVPSFLVINVLHYGWYMYIYDMYYLAMLALWHLLQWFISLDCTRKAFSSDCHHDVLYFQVLEWSGCCYDWPARLHFVIRFSREGI